jgi:hypothetical protein
VGVVHELPLPSDPEHRLAEGRELGDLDLLAFATHEVHQVLVGLVPQVVALGR